MHITLIIRQHLESCMIPPNCSIIIEGRQCGLTSTCVISVATDGEEYMIGTLCDDHFVDFKKPNKIYAGNWKATQRQRSVSND